MRFAQGAPNQEQGVRNVGATTNRTLSGDDIFVAPHLKKKKSRRAPKRPSAARHLALMTAALCTVALTGLMLMPEPLELRPTQVTGSIAPDKLLGDLGNEVAKAEEAPINAWLSVEGPRVRFALSSPDFEGIVRRYEAATHPAGGGRDDVLVFGAFAAVSPHTAPGPHMRLSIYRTGREAPAPGTFFVDLVRRAGESGLAVTKSAVATPMSSKFGAVEVADVLLAGQGNERACLAFRLVAPAPGLRLTGWQCGTAEKPADRAALGCLIDRLDLVGASNDLALANYFASTELRRQPCAQASAAGSSRKATWLDPAQSPPTLRHAGKSR
jgi:hypothetical protein